MVDNARTTLLEHARATLRSLEVSLQSLPLPRADAEGQLLVALRDGINAADDALDTLRDPRPDLAALLDQGDPEDELPF